MKFTIRQIIGIILWWAEGTKSRKDKRWQNALMYHVDFTNTDPEMIKIFLKFLRYDIGIDEKRLKIQLQIHEGDDQKMLEKFWSEITEVPHDRFTKTIVRPIGNKIGKTRGTCKIRYCDKKTYLRLCEFLQHALALIKVEKILS